MSIKKENKSQVGTLHEEANSAKHTKTPTHTPWQESNTLPRILLVTNSLYTGGAETHIIALAKGLALRGYFVAVASAGGSLEKELDEAGILHIYAPLDSILPHHILTSRKLLQRAIKKHSFQLIHAHSRLTAFVCRLLGRSRHRCVVTTAHLDFKMTPLKRRLGYWGEKTLAVSEDIRSYLIREYRLCYEDIFLTVNGIDTDRFSPFTSSSKANETVLTSDHTQKSTLFASRQAFEGENLPTTCAEKAIVHVSRMDKDRAYVAFLLCDVIQPLYEKYGVKLILVGGGKLLGQLRKKAQTVTKGKGDMIRVVGEATDVLPYLARATVFVGVSRAALEAMSCGIPTILSGNSGHLGVFRKELLSVAAATNFCCRGEAPATAAEMTRDLENLLSAGRETLATLGAECRSTVINHYSLDKMVSDYVFFYEKLRPYHRKKYNETLILGYHGFGNLGDEALLRQMVHTIRQNDPDHGITVLSHDPKRTESAYRVSSIFRNAPFAILGALIHAKTLAVGGGTLLQSETSRRSLWYYSSVILLAKLTGCTVVYYANGIGPIRKSDRFLVRALLKGNTVITLRDEVSLGLATELLANVKEKNRPFVSKTADSGFLISGCELSRLDALLAEIQGPRGESHPLFAVAPCGLIKGDHYTEELEEAVTMALEKGYRPIFLVMQPSADEKTARLLSRAIQKKQNLRVPVITPSPSEAVGLLRRCRFLLSSRLHPLIFAASVGIPAICFSAGNKCLTFAETFFGKESAIAFNRSTHSAERALCYRLCELVKTLECDSKGNGEEKVPFYPDDALVNVHTAMANALPSVISQGLSYLREQKEKRAKKKSVGRNAPLSKEEK